MTIELAFPFAWPSRFFWFLSLVNSVALVLGVAPLASWAWRGFNEADAWWLKTVIAGAALGTTLLLTFGVIRLARWTKDFLS